MDDSREERPACTAAIDQRVVRIVDRPLELDVDDAARQDQVSGWCRTPLSGRIAVTGPDWTEAEMTELMMVPAIRRLHGAAVLGERLDRPVRVLIWGLVIVGGGSPKNTPVPVARSASGAGWRT